MPQPTPGANLVVERHLDYLLSQPEDATGGNVLTYKGDLRFGADTVVRDAIEDLAQSAHRKAKLSVVLETDGGYIEVVPRIADVLRKHFDRVEFIIPNYAYSAGTILVMCGDAILMDYFSVLGPIDPQVERKGGGLVPALGYKKQYERLIEKSNAGTLSTAELAFLIEKFDPAALYSYEQQCKLSVTLLREWLVRYKFKDWKRTKGRGVEVTEDYKRERAEKIAEILGDTDRWHVHGRGINMQTLIGVVQLEIEDFGEKPALSKAIREYHRLLGDYLAVMPYDAALHTRGRYVPLAG